MNVFKPENPDYRTPYFKMEFYDLSFKERLRAWWAAVRYAIVDFYYAVFSAPAKQASRFVYCDEPEATWTMTTVPNPLRLNIVGGEYLLADPPEGNNTYTGSN